MVTAKAESETPEPDTAPVLTPTKRVVLQPLADSPKTDTAKPEPAVSETDSEAPVETDAVESKADEASAPEPEAETPAEPEADAKPEPAPEAEPAKESPDVIATDAKVGTKEVQTEAEAAAEADAEAERQAKLQEMVDNKTYYLPITTSETRKARQFVAVGVLLSIVLIAAWLDIALDAGLIHLGNLHALTHFFSE